MSIRILLVDHHSGFRQDLAAYLAGLDRGYEVVAQAGTAAEALAQAARLAPDLALVDVDLPGDNGLVATRLLRRARPATAVIVVGDDPAAEYERAALAAGASAYVDKLELVQALPAALAAVARPAVPQAQGAPYEAAGDTPPMALGGSVLGLAAALAALLAHRPARPALLLAGLCALAAWQRRRLAALGAGLARRFAAAVARLDRGPLTAWQCLHLLVALACLQAPFTLRQALRDGAAYGGLPQATVLLLALLGIAAVEARQLAHAWRARGLGGARARVAR